MTFFSTSALLDIGDVPFISHSDKPTRREALEYFRRVQESWDLNIHYYEEVTDVVRKDGFFTVESKKGEYICKNVIVATGFYGIPKMMGVPGEELPKVRHYYDEIGRASCRERVWIWEVERGVKKEKKRYESEDKDSSE